jgi:hypothetical protein
MTPFGLPLHPLVVHAAVVLLPLAALGALAIVASAKARTRYGSLVAVLAVAAGGAVAASRITGEALAGTTSGTGALGTHMTWGLLAPWPATLLAVSVVALLLVRRGSSRPLQLTMSLLTVVAALASLAVIVVVGHSGATAVWGT